MVEDTHLRTTHSVVSSLSILRLSPGTPLYFLYFFGAIQHVCFGVEAPGADSLIRWPPAVRSPKYGQQSYGVPVLAPGPLSMQLKVQSVSLSAYIHIHWSIYRDMFAQQSAVPGAP